MTHIELAKAWDKRGNRRMVKNIANSFKRMKRKQKRLSAVTASA